MEFLKGKVNIKKLLIALGIIAVLEFVIFYMYIPAINIFNPGFWTTQAIMLIILLVGTVDLKDTGGSMRHGVLAARYNIVSIVCVGVLAVGAVVFLIGNIMSMELFFAKQYASLIQVQERNFAEDMPLSEEVNDIALMDTTSAITVGQRAIGSLSDVVSQYRVSEAYSTIDFDGVPMKVATLEYDDFFKWFSNRGNGIPGYVLVDPVSFEAKYVKLNNPIKYSPSGWFNDNLQRHLRFKYPTAIFQGYYFEIDNEGNPFYICPVMEPRVGMFGGYDVKGVVICDPCTGDTVYYDVKDIPNWVDRVYDGELAIKKYDWHGLLSNGYINSIIGQKGCKVTTDDYGYKVMDGDVWVYTGVTSVTGDQSNIGFVLINCRTCETIYYSVAGAEEHSAMNAAEGQVQNLGYTASFPSLVNIGGTPTYLMVLKDKSNLVKMYAMVNVEKYSIVATGETQSKTLEAYRNLLDANDVGEETNNKKVMESEILVERIDYLNLSDGTYVYITDRDGKVYKQLFEEDETLIFINEEDIVLVNYTEGKDGINNLISHEVLY